MLRLPPKVGAWKLACNSGLLQMEKTAFGRFFFERVSVGAVPPRWVRLPPMVGVEPLLQTARPKPGKHITALRQKIIAIVRVMHDVERRVRTATQHAMLAVEPRG